MLDSVKTGIIFYGILGLIQILEAGVDFHTFIIKSDDLVFHNLKKLGRDYSNCSCEIGNNYCYEFAVTVDRKTDNCSVYGFLRSENSSVPNLTIDVSTASKYQLNSTDDNTDDNADDGKSKQTTIIVLSSIAAVGVTGAAGFFLSDFIRNLLQSNTYRL